MSTNNHIGSIGGELKTRLKRWVGRKTARTNRADDETGALLILALIFLTVISVICASLSMWSTNNLNNTGKFATALSLQSASNSVTQLAVQDVRYNFTDTLTDPTLNAYPPQPCWIPALPLAPVSQEAFNVVNVAVFCSTQWNPLSTNTRVVTFSTCPEPAFANGTSSATIETAAATCAANPFLQSVVEFDDFPSTISAANCSPQGNTTCGTTFTVLSWAFGVSVPSVTAATASAVSASVCPSAMEISITGANLTGATSVNIIQTPATNVVFPSGPILTGGTNTTLTTCASSQLVTTFPSYQISVTTSSGTSAAIPFTY
jgi:hypothetical protein